MYYWSDYLLTGKNVSTLLHYTVATIRSLHGRRRVSQIERKLLVISQFFGIQNTVAPASVGIFKSFLPVDCIRAIRKSWLGHSPCGNCRWSLYHTFGKEVVPRWMLLILVRWFQAPREQRRRGNNRVQDSAQGRRRRVRRGERTREETNEQSARTRRRRRRVLEESAQGSRERSTMRWRLSCYSALNTSETPFD